MGDQYIDVTRGLPSNSHYKSEEDREFEKMKAVMEGNIWQQAENPVKPELQKSDDGKYTIAVIDDFKHKRVDIDGDNIPDLSHGDVVSRYLKSDNDNIDVIKYEFSGIEDDYAMYLAKADIEDKRIDAISMSFAETLQYSSVSKALGEEVTPENIKENRQEFMECINSNGSELDFNDKLAYVRSDIKNVYAELNEITQEKETPVFMAIGNDINGAEIFNSYSFGDGVTNIGGVDKDGNKVDSFSNNSMIDEYSQGIFAVQKVEGGYDINEDGILDVYNSEVSSKGKCQNYNEIRGTSFSTPNFINEQINKLEAEG